MKESRRKRKRTAGPDGESNSIIKLLPSEIKLDILSRLPVESVLDCKLVCKSWCEDIRDPSFAQIHRRQQLDTGDSDDKVSFLFLTVENKARLFYGKYDESREPRMKLTVNHPSIKKRFGISAMVGSCNGLVCFSKPYTNHIHDPIYICNPSLGEKISLPRFTVMARNKNNVEFKKTAFLHGEIVSGFGYNSITDEYKVVRIYIGNWWEPKARGQVQVYTLGSGSGWRNIGECPYSLHYYDTSFLVLVCKKIISIPSPGILVDGALHWLDNDWNIVSFDLVNEKFSLLPSPPCFCPGQKNFLLQVLGGCLCVVNDQHGICLNIWSFNQKTGEWAKMFTIACASDKFIDVYWPISLTSSGKLILRFDYKTLYSYDPQRREWKFLTNTEFLSVPSEAIPHVNSFVSLKALGERSKRIRRDIVV